MPFADPWVPLVTVEARSLARPLSDLWGLSVGPFLSEPLCSCRGRTNDRAILGHAPTRPSLFWTPPSLTRPPLLSCALSRALSHSLSLCARAQEVPPPLVVVSCSFCGHCRALAVFVASVNSALSPVTWDAPQFVPFTSGSPGPHSPVHCRSSATVNSCPRCALDAVCELLSLHSR